MYLMTATRPDLAYTISTLSKFSSAPTTQHVQAAKRVLRYIKQTRKLSLTFRQGLGIGEKLDLCGYCDSDWAGDQDDRKSMSGYVFIFQGAAISWKSKKQSVVALSSTEVEYIGSSEAAKEAMWLG